MSSILSPFKVGLVYRHRDTLDIDHRVYSVYATSALGCDVLVAAFHRRHGWTYGTQRAFIKAEDYHKWKIVGGSVARY